MLHSLHIVEDNLDAAILEEIQSLTNFVEKDSAGMMAFVIAVDDVDCHEAVADEVIIVDSDISHLRTELLQIRTEENVHLTKIKHHDL